MQPFSIPNEQNRQLINLEAVLNLSCDDLGIAGYLTKNRSEKDQKIAQSTHENGYIKPRKTFGEIQKSFYIYGQILVNHKANAYFCPMKPKTIVL